MHNCRKSALNTLLAGFVPFAMAMAVSGGTLLAAGPEPVELGTAAEFGALAGGAISGTGHVNGDVGSGTGAIAPAITSTGTIYPTGDAAVVTALDDFSTAYADGMNRPYDILLSAAAYELGGKTLTPGVYRIGGAATLASPVTLNANGNPDAVFIIQIVGAFSSTASTGNVVLTNNAQSANVFWIVEGAISMGASTHTEGTILGAAAIAFGANTTIDGRLMAGSAAGTIAIDTTTISVPVEPSLVGGRVWLDSNGDGIQDPTETTGFSGLPVTLLQVVSDGLTIDLGTSANFGALAVGAISGTGHVEEDVGSGAGAIAPAITSDGTIYPTGDPVATNALADVSTAYSEGKNRPYDVLLSAAAYELGGTTLTPGTYKIGGAATLASPVTLDAGGDPEGVFIIQIVGALGATASVGNVIAMNDAESANIFWIVEGAVSMGASTHMEGTILGGSTITFGAATTMNGRLLAGSAAGAIALDTTTISAATGTPPEGSPPPIVVAEKVTDTDGNYLFDNVQPGAYIVRWDLSSLSTNFAITSDGVSGDVGGFVHTAEFEVQGGTTHLDVDLGLVVMSTTEIIGISPAGSQTIGEIYTVSVSVTGEDPTGQVTVSDGVGNSCLIDLDVDEDSCDLISDVVGEKTITAQYAGDEAHIPSSDTSGYTIVRALSVVEITAVDPAGSQQVNQPYIVHVSVDGYLPAGAVTVSDGAGASCQFNLPDESSCELVTDTVGKTTLLASYDGDANNEPGTATHAYEITPIVDGLFHDRFESGQE